MHQIQKHWRWDREKDCFDRDEHLNIVESAMGSPHDVASVIAEFDHAHTSFDIP